MKAYYKKIIAAAMALSLLLAGLSCFAALDVLEFDKDYKITDKTYEKGNVTINYPVLDLKSAKVEKLVNQRILQDVKRVAAEYDTAGEKQLYITCYDGGIVMGNISLAFTGSYTRDDGYPQNLGFALNYDYKTGARLKAPDFLDDVDMLAEAIIDNAIPLYSGLPMLAEGDSDEDLEANQEIFKAQLEYIQDMTPKALKKLLTNAGFSDKSSKAPECTVFLNVAYDGEKAMGYGVNMFFEVPHAIGDYSVITAVLQAQ